MTRIDQITADVLAGSPETHIAILAREVVRLRGEAPAVVVPELTWNECTDIANEAQMITGRSIWPSTVQAIAKVMRSRAIPADRVPGEGMVAVDAGDLDSVISEIDECAEWPHRCENSDIHRHSPAGKRIRALRANQGGANHD